MKLFTDVWGDATGSGRSRERSPLTLRVLVRGRRALEHGPTAATWTPRKPRAQAPRADPLAQARSLANVLTPFTMPWTSAGRSPHEGFSPRLNSEAASRHTRFSSSATRSRTSRRRVAQKGAQAKRPHRCIQQPIRRAFPIGCLAARRPTSALRPKRQARPHLFGHAQMGRPAARATRSPKFGSHSSPQAGFALDSRSVRRSKPVFGST